MLISYFILLSWVKAFLYSNHYCPDIFQGDGMCDEGCMTIENKYDSIATSSNSLAMMLNSDCLANCLEKNCTIELLKNDGCDDECNFQVCGWDNGKCGYCAAGCNLPLLTNYKQDEDCKTKYCFYDNNQYGWCALNCSYEDFYSNVPKSACNVSDCNYQNGIALFGYSPSTCNRILLENTVCDEICNTAEFNYDNKKCLCADECYDDDLASNECSWSSPCMNEDCDYLAGKCPVCSSKCLISNVGDGVCQEDCNNEDCDYDGGDCGCAPGCDSKFINGQWEMKGECNSACIVESCLFNYKSCLDTDIISIGIIYSIIFKDFTEKRTIDPTTSCSTELMKALPSNQNYSSTAICDNIDCDRCSSKEDENNIGSDNCELLKRSCLTSTYSKTFNFRGDRIFDSLTVSDFGSRITKLDKITGSEVYFIKEGSYLIGNPLTFTVNNKVTLYEAMVMSAAPNVKISIEAGEYELSLKNSWYIQDLLDDPNAPLYKELGFTQYTIIIEGSSQQTTVINFLDEISFKSKFSKTIIRNLTFKGHLLIDNKCNNEKCYYCPYFTESSGYIFTDKYELVNKEFESYYGDNCTDFETIIFEFLDEANIENVYFYNFQQQSSGLIKAYTSLTIKDTKFENIQTKDGTYAIYVFCDSVYDSSECADFYLTLTNVQVVDLNYGYEHLESMYQGGFLNVEDIGDVLLELLEFSYNMAISCSECTVMNLLKFTDILGTIEILDCKFESMYVRTLISIDSSELDYGNSLITNYDIYGKISVYAMDHLFINNTEFLNIYAQDGIIVYLMKNIKQNVKITNCNFTNIATMKYGLVKIDGQDSLKTTENEGYWSYQVYEENDIKHKVEVYYSPRFVILKNLKIKNIAAAPYVFNIMNYPNIIVENISIDDVSETSEDDPYNYSIIYFKKAFKYLSLSPDASLVKTTLLVSIFYASDLNHIQFNYITADTISSTSFDFCVYYVETANVNATFTGVSLSNIIGNTCMGIAIYLKSVGEIFINSLTLRDLTNSYDNMVAISKTVNVSMIDVNLQNIVTNFSAAFSIAGAEILIISDFYVDNLSSYDSKGSLFNINLGSSPNSLYISNITLYNSKNNKGRGLLIYLDCVSSQSSFDLNFTDISLKECSVEDSFLYFEFNLYLSEAIISNLLIEHSRSNKGGIITDVHSKGVLQLINFVSSNNDAIYCGVVSKYSSLEFLLSITDSIVENCECQSDIFVINGIAGTIVEMNNLKIYNNTAGNSGISVVSALLNGNGVYIVDSVLQYGIILSMADLNLSKLTCSNLTYQAVYMMDSSFTCIECTFSDLTETVLNLYQSSLLNIQDSSFFEVNSAGQDFLYMTNSVSDFSNFTNCSFYSSISSKGQFEIDKSKLRFVNCVIKDNTSGGGFCIKSGNSELTVTGSSFINQAYTIIEATVSSTIRIVSSGFYGNLTNIDGISSDLEENRKILSEQNLTTIGGAVYITDSTLEITDSIFKELYSAKGAAIYSESTSIKIYLSNFTECATINEDAGVVYLSDKYSIIESSTFSASVTETSLIRAESIELDIKSSKFLDNTNTEGAGIYVSGSTCNIEDSFFIGNHATKNGGGIYSDDSTLTIKNSHFFSNKAEQNGGGIRFDISPNSLSTLLFKGVNYLRSNSAVNGSGGAVNWDGKIPEIDGLNLYSNNSAIYGADNSSYPVQLILKSERVLNEIINFRPGGEYKDSLYICYGDIYNEIVASSDIDSKSDGSIFVDSPSSLSGTVNFQSELGCFNLTGFSIKGPPSTQITLKFKSSYISQHADVYNSEYINDSIDITVGLRPCSYGEAVLTNECISCAANKYLIEPADSCLSCPTGAVCLGGYLVLPKAGYWKLDKYSDQIYECPYIQACLGSMNISDEIEVVDLDIDEANVDFTGTCAAGYYGNMCGSCEIGYSKSTDGQCSKCPNQSSNALIMTGFLILIIAVAFVMITSTLKSAFSSKSLHSIYIKIFTNYLQIVFLTTELNLNWPTYVLKLFSVQRSAASASDQVYSIDCLFSDKTSENTADIYYYKVLLAVMLPAIVWLISLMVWVFISFYKEAYHYLKKELFTTMIVLFFLIHPNIVKTIFSSFSCRIIKNSGYWLVSDLQIKCWTASHIRTLLTISLPGVLLWGFGVPFMVLVIMIKRFRFLNKDTNKVIFGFIFNGYKQKKFFWEFVILYRKILIICVSVFMSTVSNTIQALTIVILLICALYFQYSQHPYVHKQLNYMDIEALLTATLTLYCGLYYLSNDLNEYIKTGLFCLILLGNGYFILYWLYYMAKAITDILVKVFPILRKLFKRGDYFDKSLFEKSIQSEGVYFDKADGEKKFTLFKPVSSKLKVELEKIASMNELYKVSMKQRLKTNSDIELENQLEY